MNGSNENENGNNRKIQARFGPETRFRVTPVPRGLFRGALEDELEQLKERELRLFLEAKPEAEFNPLLRRAANESASLAWLTPYPLLVFPLLFEEKAQAALAQERRQRQIRRRSQDLLALAA